MQKKILVAGALFLCALAYFQINQDFLPFNNEINADKLEYPDYQEVIDFTLKSASENKTLGTEDFHEEDWEQIKILNARYDVQPHNIQFVVGISLRDPLGFQMNVTFRTAQILDSGFVVLDFETLACYQTSPDYPADVSFCLGKDNQLYDIIMNGLNTASCNATMIKNFNLTDWKLNKFENISMTYDTPIIYHLTVSLVDQDNYTMIVQMNSSKNELLSFEVKECFLFLNEILVDVCLDRSLQNDLATSALNQASQNKSMGLGNLHKVDWEIYQFVSTDKHIEYNNVYFTQGVLLQNALNYTMEVYYVLLKNDLHYELQNFNIRDCLLNNHSCSLSDCLIKDNQIYDIIFKGLNWASGNTTVIDHFNIKDWKLIKVNNVASYGSNFFGIKVTLEDELTYQMLVLMQFHKDSFGTELLQFIPYKCMVAGRIVQTDKCLNRDHHVLEIMNEAMNQLSGNSLQGGENFHKQDWEINFVNDLEIGLELFYLYLNINVQLINKLNYKLFATFFIVYNETYPITKLLHFSQNLCLLNNQVQPLGDCLTKDANIYRLIDLGLNQASGNATVVKNFNRKDWNFIRTRYVFEIPNVRYLIDISLNDAEDYTIFVEMQIIQGGILRTFTVKNCFWKNKELKPADLCLKHNEIILEQIIQSI